MSVNEPYNIYREQLSSAYHGLALWNPKPIKNLHKGPGHVSIGDVGYLDNGSFMRMFNVTLPWDHPSNKLLVQPDEYECIGPCNVRDDEVREGEYYSPYVSKVENLRANQYEDAIGQMYQCSTQHYGALLSLPHKGYRKDVIPIKVFENYIKDNVDNWFRWSKNKGLPVEHMEDLILVTGCTLATSWAAAAFDGHMSIDSDTTTISLETQKSNHGRAQFFWRNIRGRVEYHNSDSDPNVQERLPQNQCVFIRGFRAKRSFFRTRPMRAAAEPLPDDPDNHRGDEIQVTRIPGSTKYCDPLVGILDYILKKCDDDVSAAEDIIAISHDDDLRLIEAVETLTADAIEKFLREKQMPLLIENGAAILSDSPDVASASQGKPRPANRSPLGPFLPPAMDKIDQLQLARRDQEDRLDSLPSQDHQLSSYPAQPAQPLSASWDCSIPARPTGPSSGYSVMVAGQATGKTAFLRLLLDTSNIASTTSQDQLASVAKFVQGCAGHTSHIRTVSFDVDLDLPEIGQHQFISLTLTDTPSLNVRDEVASERLVGDILRHVEAKFTESLEDEYKARTGDHLIHLCIYFLDPDAIIPPSAIRPPDPLFPRAHTNSVSQSDAGPVILEPPVTNNPLLHRLVLPQAEINVIRTLSSRVNVLPVIARADTLTNDRLLAIKMAVRRDLAEAGIGFGIFDLDNPSSGGDNKEFNNLSNRPLSSPSSSSPTSPVTTSFLRLPYALISPDCYSHSDGINRPALARHELVLQYTPRRPSSPNSPSTKLVRGKFTRSYRGGFLDVLDPNHSDFLPLRQAVYHHMQTLQKYTREYLYEKFRAEYVMQHRPGETRALQVNGPLQSLSSSSSRPILTVDPHVPPIKSALSDSGQEDNRASTKASRKHARKVIIGCNFCRSRKIACNGGRPACHQCLRRSRACDYTVPQKRRRVTRQRRNLNNSDSEGGSSDESSVEIEPSASSEAVPKPLARVGSDRELPPLDAIQQANYGPRRRACNHCRAQKMKCDRGHPTCSTCTQLSLTCNYVNNPNAPRGLRRKGSAAASKPVSAVSSGPVEWWTPRASSPPSSPPSSRVSSPASSPPSWREV